MLRLIACLSIAGLIIGSQSEPVRTQTRQPKAGDIRVNSKDGAKMVYVPPGEFLMGSNDGFPEETPPHRVRLTKGYWLYRTEVTNAMYGEFTAATGHRKPEYADNVRFNAPQQPVMGVSWDDAVAYCKWADVRLPTEAEWEYAASGTDGRKYPWGNEAPDKTRAVYFSGGVGRPAPVGALPKGASAFGALDMAGNVWEWCADRYDSDYYKKSPAVDPRGPVDGTRRVFRGGSWNGSPGDLRVAIRLNGSPGYRSRHIGFRAARTFE